MPTGKYEDAIPISDAKTIDTAFGNPAMYDPYHLDPYVDIEISANNFLYTLYQDGSEEPGYHTLICPLESIDLLTPGAAFDLDNQCGGSRFPITQILGIHLVVFQSTRMSFISE